MIVSWCPPPIDGKRSLLLFALVCAGPSLPAQARLEREISFVRALAKDMSLELARSEVDRLAAEFRGAGDQDRIAQLAVEVAWHGARTRADRNQQRTLYREAIDKAKQLIERSSDASVQTEARITLANASQELGQLLVEELEVAREGAPERAKELELEAGLVFGAGIEACGKVIERLRPLRKDPQQEIEYYLMWLRKGVLGRECARAVAAERTVLLQRATDELTNLVLEAGEETAIGLRGLFEIAQCSEVGGKTAQAVGSYRTAIGQITASLQAARNRELELTPEMQRFLFEMMQEVYARAGELMVREGTAGAGELFAEFRANLEKFGEQRRDLFEIASEQHGHLVLLAECRFLAKSGEPAKVAGALATARRILDAHAGDRVGAQARALLRDMVAAQGSLAPPNLLLELARAESRAGNHDEAVKLLQRCIAAAEPAARFDAWLLLGEVYTASERHLEVMRALCDALEQLGPTDVERARDAADALDRALASHRRQAKADPSFEKDHARASGLIATYSLMGGSKQSWKAANTLFHEGRFREAIAEYAKVQSDFVHYELARVLMARASSAAGDFDAARRMLADHRAWVAAHALDARETEKLQVRSAAGAEAAFTEVQMSYIEARGSAELQRAQDLTKYPAGLEKAHAWLANFGKDGEANVPTVLEYVGRLHADLAELDRAEEAWAQLKAKDAVRASRLATCIFQEYQSQLKTLGDELDQVVRQDKGEAAILAATQALNTVRTRLVAIGSDYIATSPKPQLAILIATMQGYEALDNWKRVEEIARQALLLYGDDAAPAAKRAVDQFVRPKIGEALLQQKHFQQAYDMLVAAEQARPDDWEVKRLICRALGGWFEFSKTGAGTRIAGLDRPAEAYRKFYGEYRVWGERPAVARFSLEWYRFQWEAYWYARQAGAADSRFKELAEKFYRIAKSTDDFATLKTHGNEGRLLFRYFQNNR
ncbi:MAG TPA: hypothetical protein VF384_09405 [Planctomycetota bacterium]